VLNVMTIKNKYPLPLISDLINQLRGAKYFTKLDVRWGYNNIQIKEGNKWKAAFWTNCSLFKPLVMFFGLTNSPATFQTMMNEIFQDLIMEGVVCVYIDNILIYTQTLEEHCCISQLVMEQLRKHKLYLWLDKCKFEQTQIEYLGLIISEGQVEMDPVKVAGVADWPKPQSKKKLQSFLGLTNFYQQFIQDFLHHTQPLFDLTSKNTPWTWGEAQSTAFNELKCAVTSQPVLMFADDAHPFHIKADSSDFATSVVLSQQSTADKKWHPVAFLSVSLNAVEQDILRDICHGNWTGAQEDAVAAAAQALKKSAAGKSLQSAKWWELQDLLFFRDCIYVPKDADLHCQIVEQHHNSHIARHTGQWKTLELVSCNYWWLQMSCYIGKYCKTCDLCFQTKAQK
jgi:hypothetical protein